MEAGGGGRFASGCIKVKKDTEKKQIVLFFVLVGLL